ncbi:asparagine synthase C-terminal domain-containing protein [Natrialbaceae archaeon GCM10025810]|uniref:asparagine synthase C-terminal domain-containing protein n=1 Tax=Halovalidus salilacus TaxID=3075124 RepID=UPI00361FBDE4
MTVEVSSDLRGADPETVRAAIECRDPLPGTSGFAGFLDGRLVRDVLGREPLYVEADAVAVDEAGGLPPETWAFEPTRLEDPELVPAGCAIDASGAQRLWSLPEPDAAEPSESDGSCEEADRSALLEDLERGIESAIADARSAHDDVAVAFSGGVDSAIVGELLDAPLYVVGFPGSADVEAAREAAEAMGRADDLTVVTLDLDALERAVPTVARAIGRTNAMDVGIALPLYLVAERAAADGRDALAIGQGADELFGGYEKVVHLDHRVEADSVRGAVREQIETLPEQLPRDVLAIRAAGVEPVAPFLHDAVVDPALRLPSDLLADEAERKRALRRIASAHLPESVAGREKKAVQYGSLVARELDRLARRAGYKRRIGDHVTKYVESRL